MSRDFTPRELLASEAVFGDLFEVQRNLIIIIDGREFLYYDKEDLAHREQFPVLGKLLNRQGFDPLYASAAAVPGGMDFLSAVDKALQEYIATGKGDRDSEAIRWFEGTLDENFYYYERNEELFVEKLQEGLYRLKPSLSDQIRAAENKKDSAPATKQGHSKPQERGK